eukprot:CAMPEP_0117669822 /NCGR_PEP_ID=MMETSP0804-20121206/12364_1 /TAXON_ID=1074897 /ORGANISM="Tetraselmis astigmatica, Strain CCMP880" /LENGTH=71 /DNA_ID=CAMNT_0005477959 /DNA_START=394 /DNA_END=609 /DNA_ORIENTATION=-
MTSSLCSWAHVKDNRWRAPYQGLGAVCLTDSSEAARRLATVCSNVNSPGGDGWASTYLSARSRRPSFSNRS